MPKTPLRVSTRATLPRVEARSRSEVNDWSIPYGAMTSPNPGRVRNGNRRMSPRTNRAPSLTPARRTLACRRRSIGSERSMPTSRAPDFKSGTDNRPVPHPNSRTAPDCRPASPRQNATSRRATVRAFSQS
jgi:hypothetical protein